MKLLPHSGRSATNNAPRQGKANFAMRATFVRLDRCKLALASRCRARAHGLLLKTHGFEGLVLIEEYTRSCHPAAS
jgi:hypothetical protein